MAARTLPQEVTEHLEAAIQLSNRHILLRFLDEAVVLLSLNQPAAAVRVAGVALEFNLASEDRQRMEKWRELRDLAGHGGEPTVTPEQAKCMIEDVRESLTREIKTGPEALRPKPSPEQIRQIRGKYKFVPTSVDDFIRRKREDLELER